MSVLTDRNSNVQPTSNPASHNTKETAGSMENGKMPENAQQSIGQKLAVNENKTALYISPSDAILSPASQKLAGFKQRQISKQGGNRTPAARTLFARTPSSCSSDGFDDVDVGKDKA